MDSRALGNLSLPGHNHINLNGRSFRLTLLFQFAFGQIYRHTTLQAMKFTPVTILAIAASFVAAGPVRRDGCTIYLTSTESNPSDVGEVLTYGLSLMLSPLEE